jgi:ceramide glucosyltransferase
MFMPLLHVLLAALGFVILAASAIYAILTLVGVVVWRRQGQAKSPPPLPPVTVLKPLCGAEPGLYEHLRSFCRQDYPEYQIVFGVRDPADPACAVALRLAAEFPSLPMELIVNPQVHGSNRKVSNLINMLPYARHDVLAMADSDAFVGPDYLASVTAQLRDSSVGLITCIYHGAPTTKVWSRLGAMYINEWYVPSVLLAWLFGYRSYVSGQTVCLRRETLQAIGGLPGLVNHLADDFRLGELVRGLRLRTVLSPYVVSGEHHEPSLHSVIRHELRWMRTLRVLRPRSFRWLFFTFSLPVAILGIVLACAGSAGSTAAWALFGTTATARLVLHFIHRISGDRPLLSDFWLLPARDVLICWVWVRSLFTSRVSWRGDEFDVDADGVMRPLS